MEATALCSRLRMSVLLLLVAEVLCDAQEADAPVILEGPLQPVMEGENVTLHCRNQMTFSKYTAEFFKDGMLMGSSNEGTIIIHSVSKSDAGPYKCQISGVGESLENWLYVVDSVFLEGPDGPVMEGDSVTLHCRNNKDPSKRIADFSRHGVLILTGYGGEITIPRVAKAHEGPYKCSISGFGESAEFQLVVQEKGNPGNSSVDNSFHYFTLLAVIIAVFLAVLLLVVGVGCFIRTRASGSSRRTTAEAEAEAASRAGSAANPDNLTYSVVRTCQRKRGQEGSRRPQVENPCSLYSTVNFKSGTGR